MKRVVPLIGVLFIVAGVYIEIVRTPPDAPTKGSPQYPRAPRSESAPAPPLIASRPASRIATQPLVESRPSAATETRPESAPASKPYRETAVIEVVREEGQPLAGVDVFVGGDDRVYFGQTDDQGRVEGDARRQIETDVALVGATFGTHVTTLVLDPGRHRIVVPTRSRVAGRVTVDGRVPDEPIEVGLSPWNQRVQTDADGRFEFFNVDGGWAGALGFGPNYAVFEGGDGAQLPLPAPSADLMVRLTELPCIKGRIVAHRTLEPVAGLVRVVHPSGLTVGDMPGHDGRFRCRVLDEATQVTMHVSDELGTGKKEIELTAPFDVVRNLGDIELAGVRAIHVRVRDREGKPISGAAVMIEDTRSTAITAEAGEATLRANERGGRLRAAKVGYAVSIVAIPDETPDKIDVVLDAGNRLLIEAQMPDGSAPPADTFLVSITSNGPMFATEGSEQLFASTGATAAFEQRVSPDQSDIALVTDGGPILLAGFRPGAVLTVALLGVWLEEVVSQKFVTMPAVGDVSVTLRSDAWPQRFAGRVRTIDGAAIDDAIVTLMVGHGFSQTRSEDEGRFSHATVFATDVDILIERAGFVEYLERDVPVPPPGAERDFILTPTRDVTIDLVDERGRLITDDASVAIRDPADPQTQLGAAELESAGRYRVRGLPPRLFEITVEMGTAHVVVAHDSRVPHVRIMVPREGVARVSWRRLAGDPAATRLTLHALGILAACFEASPDSGDPAPSFDVPLAPGLYTATIEAFDHETETWVPMTTSPAFEVRARWKTDVEMRR